MTIKCPECGKDITDSEFWVDSEVIGHMDVGFECDDCRIEVYIFCVKRLKEEEDI